MSASDPRPGKPVRSPTGQSVGPSEYLVPPGDDRERLVCRDCGYIHYENPKIVVGSVATLGDRVLLCRRAIQPRLGFWTLPAGYLEARETVADGAKREALEEACAEIEVGDLFAVYNIPRLSQVHLFFRAKLLGEAVACGPESLEVGLFRWDDLPMAELAFPTTHWALAHYREVPLRARTPLRSAPIRPAISAT
ncbi:MAG: NUDIX hydrolase [Rhodospirillaceae bacterium]|nr:NUDIX hydrolase [Rhodospirillaceae bacterium]